MRRTLLVAAAVSTLALAGCGAGKAGEAGPAPTVTVTTTFTVPQVIVETLTPETPTPTAKATPAKAPAAKVTIPDGYEVEVGVDIPSGTYQAHSTSSDCYWEIDKHASSDIINNDAGKQGHLTIKLKAGEDFSSHDCGDWTKE